MSRYIVGGQGMFVDSCSSSDPGPRTATLYPAGTIIDDSLPAWAFLAKRGPPIDAAPLDWPTYEYMISLYVVGLGFPYWRVSTRFLTTGGPFVLDQSQLGGVDVLGGAAPVVGGQVFGLPPNTKQTVGPNVDYWGRPCPWTE
jgi:hypothetical protein